MDDCRPAAGAELAPPPRLAVLLGADLRSLALFRVGLGLVTLGDLVSRSFDLRAHYTDTGVLPTAALPEHYPWFFSLHAVSGGWLLQAALLAAAACCAVGLIAGYRTRLACLALWGLTISLQNRNPLLLYGGDTLLRLMLFWGMLLPLGRRAAIDVRRKPAAPARRPWVVSWATAGLAVQVAGVYFFSALLKSGPTWAEGTAVYYALNIDYMVTHFGRSLLGWPGLLRAATHVVYYGELLAPLLLFCPVWPGPVRTLAVGLFVALHAVFAACFELGVFPWVGAAGMLGLLPAWFWERLRRRPAVAGDDGSGGASDYAASRAADGWTAATARRRPSLSATVLRMANRFMAVGALVAVLWWNLSGLPGSLVAVPQPLRNAVLALRLDQKWWMFAPDPFIDDGWFVVRGVRADGAEVDPLGGGAVPWHKPALISATHRSDRWQEYMRSIWLLDNLWARPYLASYLCRSWNQDHPGPERLERLDLFYMLEETPPPGEAPVLERITLWEHECG